MCLQYVQRNTRSSYSPRIYTCLCVCVCLCVRVFVCVCTRARLCMLYPLRRIHHHHHHYHHHHFANMDLGHLLTHSSRTRLVSRFYGLPWLLPFVLYFFIILGNCILVGRKVKLENLTVAQLVNTVPFIYGTATFIFFSIRVLRPSTSNEQQHSKVAFEEPSQLMDHRDISNTVDSTCACRVAGASDSDIRGLEL